MVKFKQKLKDIINSQWHHTEDTKESKILALFHSEAPLAGANGRMIVKALRTGDKELALQRVDKLPDAMGYLVVVYIGGGLLALGLCTAFAIAVIYGISMAWHAGT